MERPTVPARIHAGVVTLLCALTWAVYAQVRDHEFISIDDAIYIVDNPNLAEGVGVDTVVRAFSEPYEDNWIPLTWISLLVDHAWFGFEPAGYLLVNVGLHAASAVLLYGALALMTGAWGPSAFTAAVFAVHPVHVESVAWASERKDALSGVFFMLTLVAYARYAQARSVGRYLLVAVALSLGLLAKPMLVSVPLLLLLLDYWPLRRLGGDGGRPDRALVWRRVAEKLPLVAICGVVAAITLAAQARGGALWPGELMSVSLRVMNALHSYVAYLTDSFWPANLGIFYPHLLAGATLPVAAGNAAILIAITLVCAFAARARPAALVGWLWYLIALVPVIGLVQVGMQGRADRYMYLPQIGLTLAVVWPVFEWGGRRRAASRALGALGAALIATLAWLAWHQVAHWRNSMALYAQAVAVNEDNALAQLGLANELRSAGRAEEARPHFERAIALKHGWAPAHIGLADTYAMQGRYDEAIAGYERALQLAPRSALGHANLGKALAEIGETARSLQHHRRALALYGRRATPEALANFALALEAAAELDEAEQSYRRSIALRPEYAAAHAHLGMLLLRRERYADASVHLDAARALGESSSELYAGLARASEATGNAVAAIAHYRSALRERPGWLVAANNLAWLLATHPDVQIRDGPEAVRLVEARAQGAAPDAVVLDTLAAAYAAAGRYEQARATARAGALRARSDGDEVLAVEIEQRLRLYESERPFLAERREDRE